MPATVVPERANDGHFVAERTSGGTECAPTRVAGVVDVSVCIVNWNCRDWLRALLQSLRVDQGVCLEVIVVDNASTDGAPEMTAAEFPEVVLVRNSRNLGFSRANNQAAELARGKYLFFLNNDTVVPPGTVRRLLDYAEAHGDVGLLGPRLRSGDGVIQVSYRPRPTLAGLLHRTLLLRWSGILRRSYLRYRRDHFDPDRVRDVDILMGAALFARRDHFLAWGGWDEDFTFGGEDMELSLRIGLRARVVYCPEVEILHHGRVSTRQHAGFAATHIAAGTVRFLRKTGCPRLGVLVFKVATTFDAPCVIAAKGLETLVRRLQGKTAKAQKSWLAVQGAWHFLTRGLITFWRA